MCSISQDVIYSYHTLRTGRHWQTAKFRSLDEMIESVSSTKFLCFLGPTIALLALCLTTIMAEARRGKRIKRFDFFS